MYRERDRGDRERKGEGEREKRERERGERGGREGGRERERERKRRERERERERERGREREREREEREREREREMRERERERGEAKLSFRNNKYFLTFHAFVNRDIVVICGCGNCPASPSQQIFWGRGGSFGNYVQRLATEFMFYCYISQLLHLLTGCSL